MKRAIGTAALGLGLIAMTAVTYFSIRLKHCL